MAGTTVHVASICSVLSFVYISHTLERHSLTERPRLSTLLVLLLSALICYVTSILTKFFPGADGRFTAGSRASQDNPVLGTASDEALLRGSTAHLPNRPRRWSLPALIFIIVMRLEVFHQVNNRQQCATPGLESFLCILLIGYEIFATRRRWGFPMSENADDPWRSTFDELYDWFSGPRVVMVNTVASALVVSLGTFLSISQIRRSTYFCFALVDSRPRVVSLQILGVVLDAAILVLLWRLLSWTRTIRLRILLIAMVLAISSLCIGAIWLANNIITAGHRMHVSFGSLYGFDVVVDSFAFAILLMSFMFWIGETSPITPVSVLTFLVGIWSSCDKILHFGDWLHISRLKALGPLWILTFGTILFVYLHDLRSIFFIRRILLASLLLSLLLAATIFTFVKQPESFESRHPVNDLIYAARSEHDRWLALVSTSTTLRTAVDIYQERHEGRVPPPNFGEWFKFADEAHSEIIDNFQQLDRDIDPFWAFPPHILRQRADTMANTAGVAKITVKDGEATWGDTGDEGKNKDLEEVGKMIQKFSNHLPDMVLPINLSPTPRILPPKQAISKGRAALLMSVADLLSKRSDYSGDGPAKAQVNGQQGEKDGEKQARKEAQNDAKENTQNGTEKEATNTPPFTPAVLGSGVVWASDFRRMLVEGCPSLSRSRTRPHWNFMEFCWSCVKPHSYGQLPSKWQNSLDVCSQPDLRLLHGFSLTDPGERPIRQLMPLFGASKTDEFMDIVIPIPKTRLDEPDIKWQFTRRYDSLFWRGVAGHHAINNQALRGSHKYRLLHLVSKPYASDKVTMVLPKPSPQEGLRYEDVSASEANAVVPFSVGVGNYSMCVGNNCRVVESEYGMRDDDPEPLEYRYVLLLDEDDGPPKQVLRTIRSNSVPFISTIFRTWFTERLMPWLHFVPVDPRYEGLHTTFSYFSGTEGRPKVNGRETSLQGRTADAEWIIQQGQRWADKALREKDMEIYLFRLLLEWGRLIDDLRDEIGFRKDEKGSFQNDGWTRQQNAGG